ncbi:MAG TPA: YetF domain-containing protein [Acidimicrobiia bacterium]|nr:YetF domain-containing protein [Acidimicrobiia bacterium]
MLVGDSSWALLLEIVVRTGVMYLFTLALIRLLGKRGTGQLSPFELVIIVALGSAVGDPMLYGDIPLLHGMVVITAVVGLERVLVLITEHSKFLARILESEPCLMVKDGEVVATALKDEAFSEAELFMALRMKGIEQLGEVRLAFLEPAGQLSVFRFDPPRQGRSILPHLNETARGRRTTS